MTYDSVKDSLRSLGGEMDSCHYFVDSIYYLKLYYKLTLAKTTIFVLVSSF